MSADEALEVAAFLRAWPPFSELGKDDVVRVAGLAELEELPAGMTVFAQGEGPVTHLRVIRRGAVEIVSYGRVLDLLGEG